MNIYNIYAGSYFSNCYLLVAEGDDEKNHAAVIDPSVDVEEILSLAQRENAVIDMIILTHGHFDHILSLDSLRAATGAPAYIHKEDAEMLANGKKNANYFFFRKDFSQSPAQVLLEGGEVLKIGNEEINVIHLPGHSKGSIALMGQGFLITGDTLFAEGFGRYDLHGGDPFILRNTLNSMKDLDPTLTIYPGHGESEKLGRALRNISYFLN